MGVGTAHAGLMFFPGRQSVPDIGLLLSALLQRRLAGDATKPKLRNGARSFRIRSNAGVVDDHLRNTAEPLAPGPSWTKLARALPGASSSLRLQMFLQWLSCGSEPRARLFVASARMALPLTPCMRSERPARGPSNIAHPGTLKSCSPPRPAPPRLRALHVAAANCLEDERHGQ